MEMMRSNSSPGVEPSNCHRIIRIAQQGLPVSFITARPAYHFIGPWRTDIVYNPNRHD